MFLYDYYTPKNTSKTSLILNILNENQYFQIIDNHQLVTRGRIDREHYVFEKLCQNIQKNNNMIMNFDEDYSLLNEDLTDDPSQIDCTIILEFALISQNRTFKPILINIPVYIQDINDNIPRFDQYTSGLKLEISEDVSTIDHYYVSSMLSSLSAPQSSVPPYLVPYLTTESPLIHNSGSSSSSSGGGGVKKREIAILPLAKDFDYGLNGTVAYKLEGPDAEYFELLNHTTDSRISNSYDSKPKTIKSLHLISRFTLDRERKSEYRLILLAYDQSEQFKLRNTAQLPISIYIKEVNEYAPKFNFGINITNQQGNTIRQQLSNIDHTFIGHSNRFHPQVQIKSFSYDSKLIVGEQQNQDRVEDNNHIKLPDSNYLILGLPEDINVGSRIYRVQAIDFDSIDFSTINNPYQSYQSTHPRITVHYFIAQETDLGVKHYFRLGKEDGWIILIQRLDYESGPRNYILPIVAIDFGRPQLSSTLTLTIQVLDVNDEAPSITIRGIESTNINHNNYQRTIGHSTMDSFNPTHFQILAVRENSPIGTFIAKVSARDRDTGASGEVECYLSEADNFGRRTQESGSSLESDYLKGLQNFALHHVEDDSIHSATISNNIEPTVSSSYIQHKQSNVLGRHDTEYILMTKTILNREVKNSYFIYLTCHDHVEKKSYLSYSLQTNNNMPSSTSTKRLSSTKLLKINILDENDNGPQFDRLRYEVKILENSIENTELIKLNAIDKDEESHIGYRFVQITDQFIQNYTDFNLSTIYAHFKIDSKSGKIKTTNIPLDREIKDSMIIPVIAYDDEFPSRTSHAWIHVEIEDVNDNIPKLIGNTTFWIDEEDTTMEHLINGGNHNRSSSSTTLGTRQYHSTNHHIFIGCLNGEDYDIGENGKIIFKLAYENQYNMNSPKWFLRSDGNLFVQSIKMYNNGNIDNNNNHYYLDREKTPFYEIPIIISDLGKNPTLSSTVTITISLRDVNDNSPKFIKPSYNNNLNLSHILVDHDPIRSTLNDLNLKTLNIPIERINIYNIDNTNPGTLIYTVHAIDLDDGDNGKIIYKLEVYKGYWQLSYNLYQSFNNINHHHNQSLNDYFIIDQISGEIRINQLITNENLQKIPKNLIILAEDCGIPSRRNYALLYIDFINKKQNKQIINNHNYYHDINHKNIKKNNLDTIDQLINSTNLNEYPKNQYMGFYSNKNINIHGNNNNPQQINHPPHHHQSNLLSTSKMKYTQLMNKKLSFKSPSLSQLQNNNNNNNNNDNELEKLIPIYENSINTEPMEIINPYQNSTELITGLGIGLVIIILVCLLLLITYALHGVQTIRLNRNRLHIDRHKLHNNTMKQYQYKSDKSNNNNHNINNQVDGKNNDHTSKWKHFCNVIQLIINRTRPLNNETMPKSIKTVNSSKSYALNQDKNKSYNVLGMTMDIPFSNDWESVHSEFNPTNSNQKQISNDKKLNYVNKTMNHQCIYPQISTFVPVMNSVEMDTVCKHDTCEISPNDTINTVGNTITTKHNQLLQTNISQDESQPELHNSSDGNSSNNNNNNEPNSNCYPRIYTVCTNGILPISDYMTLNLPDNHSHYVKHLIPSNCHFLTNNIDFHRSNMTVPKVSFPHNDDIYLHHHHHHQHQQQHHESLMNTSNELHNQSHLLTQTPVTYSFSSSSSSSLNYCTSPGQYCRIPSTINNSNKLSNSLKNCIKQHVMLNRSNDKNQMNIVKSTEQINKMLNNNNINQQNIPEDSFKANSLKSGSFV
ncbi:unnamed protein product [Schistosoma margrebowiei]|uniref:Cadherin domain-containing protein n=1 Tax=Schistosoma margrebowiei TaxID=48269 RepID=A0AA85ALJ3_9TREM|nr:unnamed protein product [Schistosoma margrebowiei]